MEVRPLMQPIKLYQDIYINRRTLTLLAILLLAFGVRALFGLVVAPDLVFQDQDEYFGGAQRLLSGQPLPVKNWELFVRPPGYSLFIAGVWALYGSQSMVALKVAQSLLGAGTCLYVYLMATLISPRRTGALLAMVLCALYPYYIHFAAVPGSEAVFHFFVAAGIYHFARGLNGDRPDLRQVTAGAFLLALGNLVRVNLSVVLPLIGCWLLFRFRARPRALVGIGLSIVLPLLLVTLPWNYAVWRQGLGLMWVTDGAGTIFLLANCEEAASMACDPHTQKELEVLNRFPGIKELTRRPEFIAAAALPPPDQTRALMRATLSWDLAHLDRMPCLIRYKLLHYWRPFVSPTFFSAKMVLVSLAAVPVLLFGMAGVLMAWWRATHVLATLTLLQVISGTMMAAILTSDIRFRLPIMDVMLLPFAGFGIASAFGLLRRRFGRTRVSKGP